MMLTVDIVDGLFSEFSKTKTSCTHDMQFLDEFRLVLGSIEVRFSSML